MFNTAPDLQDTRLHYNTSLWVIQPLQHLQGLQFPPVVEIN